MDLRSTQEMKITVDTRRKRGSTAVYKGLDNRFPGRAGVYLVRLVWCPAQNLTTACCRAPLTLRPLSPPREQGES